MKATEKGRQQGIKIKQMTGREETQRETRLVCNKRTRQQEVMEVICWPRAWGESNKV